MTSNIRRDRTTHIYGSTGNVQIEKISSKVSNTAGNSLLKTNNHIPEQTHKYSSVPVPAKLSSGSQTPPRDILAGHHQHRPNEDKRRVTFAPIDKNPTVSVSTRNGDIVALNSRASWREYYTEYEVNFGGGFFQIASKHRAPGELMLVKQEFDRNIDERLDLIRNCNDDHVVRYKDCIEQASSYFLVFELMDMSLLQVASALRRPSEEELATITAHVIRGLQAIERHGIVHGCLTMFNILVNLRGEVKIFLDESCKAGSPSSVDHKACIVAVGEIALELAAIPETSNKGHSYVDEQLDFSAYINQNETYPDNTYAEKLRSFKKIADSGELELIVQHPFLTDVKGPVDLKHLFHLAHMSARFMLRRSTVNE